MVSYPWDTKILHLRPFYIPTKIIGADYDNQCTFHRTRRVKVILTSGP